MVRARRADRLSVLPRRGKLRLSDLEQRGEPFGLHLEVLTNHLVRYTRFAKP